MEKSNTKVAYVLISAVVVFVFVDVTTRYVVKTEHLMVMSGLVTALLAGREAKRGK